MRKLFYILGIVVVVSLAACSTEKPVNEPGGTTTTTSITVPITRADGDATADEVKINSVRLIIFRSPGQYNGGQFVLNKRKTTAAELATPFLERVPTGKLDIYIIVNELSAWNLGSNNDANNAAGLTPAIIKNKERSWTAYPVVNSSNPIPMFKCYEGVEIDEDGNMTYEGVPFSLGAKVERTLAKVIVNINFDSGIPLEITSLNVSNIPRRSWLYAAPYNYITSADFFNGTAVSPVIDATENLDQGKPNRKYTFYLPEYFLMEPYWRTYITLVAANKSFVITLGDGMAVHDRDYMNTTNNITDLRISRNHCYILNVLSITGDILIKFNVGVMLWDYTGVPVE